jgi:hypothetical protein
VKSQKNNLVIFSGGQTGVDRAALDFAYAGQLSYTGWCPLQRYAEDGPVSLRHPLLPTFHQNPDIRTELNVISTDGTLIINHGEMDRGTQFTHDMAKFYGKPLFVWIIFRNSNTGGFHRWLRQNNIRKLNIAGPRESTSPGIYNHTLKLLDELFEPFLDEKSSYGFKPSYD